MIVREILEGLRGSQKTLPSKYFYDEEGSRLFERITRLEEYYPTRTELGILEERLPEIARRIGENAILIELGSGSSRKTRMLLDELPELAGYVPVDISGEYLAKVTEILDREYPDLMILPVSADYTRPMELPELRKGGCRYVFFYPGSTIGNFEPPQARDFMQSLSRVLKPGEGMLIGVDLQPGPKKPKSVIEAAYDDREGVTAAFNKNILVRINRELQGDFDPEAFDHRAFYNGDENRMEMHLVSRKDQRVTVAGETFVLRKGETIHTENSYKYSLEGFAALVRPWFETEQVWTDRRDYFSVHYLKRTRQE